MKERKQLSDLQEVFVSFETEKIEGCSVVYFNDALADGKSAETVLDSYSYIVRPGSSPSVGQSSIKQFMAERYGGDGILTNGGGGRCGFDGVWQLKGIGPNILVGHDVGESHGDGNLSLDTAIYESIWAEIINVALPFGAIRTIAVLDTALTYGKQGIATPRGLLIRQPVVRPAHFMRAIYFNEKQFNRLCDDALRVKSVLRQLIDILPASDISDISNDVSIRLNLGLNELAARLAKQFAVAKTKHIIHYNVSASNLSMDGAWLDLSGTRLFSDIIDIDQSDIDIFNTEHLSAVRSLQSICYYLNKYYLITAEDSIHIQKDLTRNFLAKYDEEFNLHQVAQAGFPLWILRITANSLEFKNFSHHLSKAMRFDDFAVQPITFEGGWAGYERWTVRLYRELLSNETKPEPNSLSWLSTASEFHNQLMHSYKRLIQLASTIAIQHNISLQNLHRTIFINLIRLNRSQNVLHNLKTRIENIRIDTSTPRLTAFKTLADEAVSAAALHLKNEQGRCVPFWLSPMLSIWFDPVSGILIMQETGNRSLSFESFVEFSQHHKSLAVVVDFYGDEWLSLNNTA